MIRFMTGNVKRTVLEHSLLVLLCSCALPREVAAKVGRRMRGPEMQRKAVYVPGRPQSSSPLSPAIQWGDLLFLSGATGADPLTGHTHPDIKEQTQQCLENLRGVLESAGSNFDHVLKATVFLVDIRDRDAMNEVFREYFPSAAPARSTVGIAALGHPTLRVEIEMVAAVPRK